MRTSAVLMVSIVFFLVMASLCKTSEGFVASLTARRDQVKAGKRKHTSKDRKTRRRLRKLLNKEKELERKLTDITKWVKKYKSAPRSKTSKGRFSGADVS
ncbi:hypothetical protein OS493_017247 [Desmophyllum pertusum]|uniref:Uncharacterized protein n=1 Tax=Desmophyllum pertusum TaxID=174260 RepID=A0A9X0A145_9CNID|nr:hypothetical protein OS493_017247 [Desmophyllum pertusum]